MFDDIAENNQIVKVIRGGGKLGEVGPQEKNHESPGIKKLPGRHQSNRIQVDAVL